MLKILALEILLFFLAVILILIGVIGKGNISIFGAHFNFNISNEKSRWFALGLGIALLLISIAIWSPKTTPHNSTDDPPTTDPPTTDPQPTPPQLTPPQPCPANEPNCTTNNDSIPPPPKSILDQVKAGNLKCGIDGSFKGFSDKINTFPNKYEGFDVDYCRVIAAAIFGNNINVTNGNLAFEKLDEKIIFEEVPGNDERFTYLEDGRIDVLFRNTSWTVERALKPKIEFGPTIFYDEQRILAKNISILDNIEALEGKRLCVTKGTTSEKNINQYLKANGLDSKIIVTSDNWEKDSLFQDWINNDKCDAITGDLSQLRIHNKGIMNDSNPKVKLVKIQKSISQELLSPAFIDGDPNWRDIINYSVYATIRAAELGISQDYLRENISEIVNNTNNLPEIQKLLRNEEIRTLLGIDDSNIAKLLGLDKEFARNIILLVGNYYDIFNRNLKDSYGERPLNGPSIKDKNQLWYHGGVLISPPFSEEN